MRNAIAGLVGLALLLVAKAAWAAFHLIRITEVFPGTVGAPDAQYIELQMYLPNQNLVSAHAVTVYDAAGAPLMTYTFAANVANAANQATILLATAEAAALFGVTADLAMTPVIPLAGGKVCFESIDCVAWGNYTGVPIGVGTPARQALGLIRGRAIARRLDIAGGSTTLEGADDTDDSANDFATALPTPRTNAGVDGTPPASVCGNGAIEGLESCDDNNTSSNDGCSSTCVTEACGDGIVQTNEECDDGNSIDFDTCSNTCIHQVLPNDDVRHDAPLGPDAGGNPASGDGGGCCQGSRAGAAPWLALVTLGLLLWRRRTLASARSSRAPRQPSGPCGGSGSSAG